MMLVDHHCHIDRPEFASDLDGVVARAHAAGVGIMVNISTRVRKFDHLISVVERFDTVYGTVGTHPHYAHEELDVTAVDLRPLRRAPQDRRHRRSRSRLLLQALDARGSSPRLPHATSPPRA